MRNIIKHAFLISLSIYGVFLTFVPEGFFLKGFIPVDFSNDVTLILNKIIYFISCFLIVGVYLYFRKSLKISGVGYEICLEPGDIFDKPGKKVIAFDECFTTTLGNRKEDIKPSSVCGQFLTKNPNINIPALIGYHHLSTERSKSQFNRKDRYQSGKLIPYEDYLLMAFVKLNNEGLGYMTEKEYTDSLAILWEEIDAHYGQTDVYIPILGSGITHFRDQSLTKQKLLDIMIASYKLTPYKIKLPNKLHIVYREDDTFTLRNVGTTL